MCTGMEVLAIASAASTVGGSAMQADSQQAKIEAQEREARRELQRQEGFDEQRYDNFQEALAGLDRESLETQMAESAGEREQRMQEVVSPGGDGESEGSYGASRAMSTPQVVRDAGERGRQDSDDFVAQLGNARARMGGWGDAFTLTEEDLSDIWRQQETLGRRGRRSAEIGELEAREAYQNTGNKRAMGGNLLTTLGQIGSFAAGAGGVASGANAASTASTAGGATVSPTVGQMFADPAVYRTAIPY